MSKILPKPNLTVKHIWMAYVQQLLQKQPDYYTRNSRQSKVKYFYVYRKDETGKSILVLSFPMFNRVIETFFMEARKRIIQGEAIQLNECGKILATRVERRHGSKRMINRGATKKQPLVWNEEKNRFSYSKIIYYVDDDWCRIDWLKLRIRNSSFYTFQPTDSSSTRQAVRTLGFQDEFSEALTNNKLLKFKYWYQPVKPRRQHKHPHQNNEHGIQDHKH